MSFDRRRARLACSAVLVAGVLSVVSGPALAGPVWIESASGCKVESQDPKPKDAFEWTGTCVDGYAQGPGVLTWTKDGQPAWTFRGSMKAGRPTGAGRLEFAHGDVYEGSFIEGRRTGQGSYVTSDSRYTGGFVDGAFSGQGRFVTRDRLDYQGELLADRWDGEGLMRWSTGEVMKGRWKAGLAQSGEISRSNGDICSGSFLRNQLSGEGRCSWANGDAYEGGMLAGALDGEGDYRFRDGRRYQGAFKQGLPSGTGALSRQGAVVYRGSFESGAPNSVDGLVMGDGRKLRPDEATTLLSGLKFEFSSPVPMPGTPLSGRKLCIKMGAPAMPKIQTTWRGEASFKVVIRIKDGKVVDTETTSLTRGVDREVSRAMVGSINTALFETYECPGNHLFEMEFSFKL